MTSDVCIVGGAGHVGLPLALVLADKGQRVCIFDTNTRVLESLEQGVLPHMEQDAQPYLDRALSAGRLRFTSDAAAMGQADTVIVTIGTPVDEFLNPNTAVIKRWAQDALRYLTPDQLIILRSTLYPGTTQWLDDFFVAAGRRLCLAYCPERIAQGQAIRELATLPQLVSGTTPEAEERAARFFQLFAREVVRLPPMEAEFAKLFTNAYRYIVFAIVNQFYMLATDAGLDPDRILDGCRHNYPRMNGMPSPGLTAGPCLFKDTMQLAAFSNNRFLLGHSAMLINEGLPAFLVNLAKQQLPLRDRTVGILGMAFKSESDDARASLSYKLKKILDMEAGRVLCTDPYVKDTALVPLEQVVEQADVLFVAAPHDCYRTLSVPPAKLVIDVWNCLPATSGAAVQIACDSNC